MPIVLISESLLLGSTATDGRMLRDRQLCGFCVKMNARKRTFKVRHQRCRQAIPHGPRSLAADEHGRG